MTLDKRFALVTSDNKVLYPYQKPQKATGRFGFALSTPEHGSDRFGGGYYTTDLAEAVRGVVFQGWGIRARTILDSEKRRDGTYQLNRRAVKGYWLAPELSWVAVGASIQPLEDLPLQNVPPTTDEQLGSSSALIALGRLGASDYIAAWEALEHRIAPGQRSMLLGHAAAPQHTLSMQAVAELGDYASYRAANFQYGKLGKLFAEFFFIGALENSTQALAISGPRDAHGQWQWTVRPALVEALRQLGMLEESVDSAALLDAVAEVESDPKCKSVSETTRRALINARVGQGGYRTRMLRLWEGQCALTSCGIETVLVASHAKPWAQASNEERLDEYNGLLLAASVDRLFDSGLISFTDDGSILISPSLQAQDMSTLGLNATVALRRVADRHKPYLQAHRQAHGFEC